MGVVKRREDRRLMMFGDAHSMWTGGRLTQEQAAELPGVGARTFRRWTDRHGEDGTEGLRDRRVSRAWHRTAPTAPPPGQPPPASHPSETGLACHACSTGQPGWFSASLRPRVREVTGLAWPPALPQEMQDSRRHQARWQARHAYRRCLDHQARSLRRRRAQFVAQGGCRR